MMTMFDITVPLLPAVVFFIVGFTMAYRNGFVYGKSTGFKEALMMLDDDQLLAISEKIQEEIKKL